MRDYAETVDRLRLNEKLFNERDAINIATLYRDAADAIEELLAAVPQWISVEERLPDVAEKVLTYNGDFVSENWLCTVSSKTEIITVWAYSEGFVTHWMPLPAPPKEG